MVAEKIRKKVSETPFQIASDELTVTVSIGTNSTVPVHSEDRSAMFDQADEALYTAKNRGRNQVASYHQDQQADHSTS